MQHNLVHGYSGPLSFPGEEEEEAVRHPSPAEAAEVVGEPCPDRRAVEVAVVEVAYRVREEVVAVHQALQVVGEEEEAEEVVVVVGAYFAVAAGAGVEGEVAVVGGVQERWPVASGRMP